MNSIERWKDIGHRIDFHVSMWTGGGIGDCAHHYKDLAYFRVLRHLKEIFPNLHITLQLVGNGSELTKTLFELDPNIDKIVTVQENRFFAKNVSAFMEHNCDLNKVEYAELHPMMGQPEVVFHRAVNRIYSLIRFPRQRTIPMDDFFQQMKLDINDLEWDVAEIFLSADDKAFGKRIKDKIQKSLVGIHWFSKDHTRTCITVKQWREIISGLQLKGYGVVIFGAPHETDSHSEKLPSTNLYMKELVELGNEVSDINGVVGVFFETLREKIAVIKECDYMLCIDGAMMHLAWLHAIPTLTISEEKIKDKINYFDDMHGFQWAAAAGEPFAGRLICGRGKAKELSAEVVISEMEKLSGTKGQRTSTIWQDQLITAGSVVIKGG